MDLPNYVGVFSEFMREYQPVLDSTIKFGTSAYTIGSSLVKVLQQGKHLATIAVGKKKAVRKSKSDKKTTSRARSKESGQITVKKDVAIVVEISRPAVRDAVSFLKKKKKDANLVVITPAREPGEPIHGLDSGKPKLWSEVVEEFSTAIDAIKNEMGSVHMHIFLATPVVLAFGLGTVWGTVDEATIYHWDGKSYQRVLEIKRELRFKAQKGKK
jgi:hypothetical protein